MSEMKKIWKREEIPVEHTWATEDLYATDAAWEEDLLKMVEVGRLEGSGEADYMSVEKTVANLSHSLNFLFKLLYPYWQRVLSDTEEQ